MQTTQVFDIIQSGEDRAGKLHLRIVNIGAHASIGGNGEATRVDEGLVEEGVKKIIGRLCKYLQV